jgi:hypothetical protein
MGCNICKEYLKRNKIVLTCTSNGLTVIYFIPFKLNDSSNHWINIFLLSRILWKASHSASCCETDTNLIKGPVFTVVMNFVAAWQQLCLLSHRCLYWSTWLNKETALIPILWIDLK